MNYEERIVCFIDILGFRSILKDTLNADGGDKPERIEHLAQSIMHIREMLEFEKTHVLTDACITQFSDSIVISFPIESESSVFYCLLAILDIQIMLVYRGILLRGGVARGKAIHTPELLFGPAMNKAYYLESKKAVYPRIILEQEIIEAGKSAHARHHIPEQEEKSIMSLLSKDSDGFYFVDYICKAQNELDDPELDYPMYLFELRNLLQNGLENPECSIRKKYEWAANNFSPHLTIVKTDVIKLVDNFELQESYQSIKDLTVSSCSTGSLKHSFKE